MVVPPEKLRQLTLALGATTTGFGLVGYLFPDWLVRAFGLSSEKAPTAEVLVRSVCARDAVSGLGILSATWHGGRVAPWLLARLLADVGDAVAVSLAVVRGARNLRLLALGALAVGAALADFLLYTSHRATAGVSRASGETGAG